MARWKAEALITVPMDLDVSSHAECLAACSETALGFLPPELAKTAQVRPRVLRTPDLHGGDEDDA